MTTHEGAMPAPGDDPAPGSGSRPPHDATPGAGFGADFAPQFGADPSEPRNPRADLPGGEEGGWVSEFEATGRRGRTLSKRDGRRMTVATVVFFLVVLIFIGTVFFMVSPSTSAAGMGGMSKTFGVMLVVILLTWVLRFVKKVLKKRR